MNQLIKIILHYGCFKQKNIYTKYLGKCTDAKMSSQKVVYSHTKKKIIINNF